MATDTWRRLAVGGVLALVASLAGCTGGDDPAPRTLLDPSAPASAAASASNGPDEPPTAGGSALDLALLTVPARAEYISFTDVAAVKDRLGYGDLTGESPTRDRFEFWERARADGAMLTGTRLYDDSSLMAIDYGWTAEDVDWEVDFSSAETGCLRSMLCERASGYVLALRRSLAWRSVLESLDRNGFAQLEAVPGVWATDDERQPFDQVLLIPQLHAIAGGNADGLRRLVEVVGGADSVAASASPVAQAPQSPESAYLDLTGCVSLGEALGPEATDDDVSQLFKASDPTGLADPLAYGVFVQTNRVAVTVSVTGASVTAEQLAGRQAVVDEWHSVQAGVPFSGVATASVDDSPGLRGELGRYDVSSMPAFLSMVLTHDAPWALCATQPPA